MAMTPDRWSYAKTLFAEAMELPPEQRDEHCRRRTSRDPEICKIVFDLLHAEASASHFLETPYLSDVPELFVRGRLLTGEMTGPYRFEQLVVEAGSTSVYRARRADGLLERDVAVKVHWGSAKDSGMPRRLIAELRALSAVDHHGVCRLFDVVHHQDDAYCIILEWIEGKQIQRMCDDLRISINDRVRLLIDVLDAVDHIHMAGFLHGDLKEVHVIVNSQLKTKLIDFGASRKISALTDNAVQPLDMTPEYVSPELLKSEIPDERSDLYSFGILMYRLLAGRYPFYFRSRLLPNIADAVLNDEPLPPVNMLAKSKAATAAAWESEESLAAKRSVSTSKLRTILGSDLSLIMLRLLQKDRTKRYQSARELSHDLKSWLSNKPTVASVYRSELTKSDIEPFNHEVKAFLCHCSEDKPQVRELYGRLRSIGVSAWFDEEDLVPGQEWRDEITKAVAGADVVVVCLSELSLTKRGFVQKELRFALDIADEQPQGRIFVIPVRLADCDVPDRLKKWQWVNLFEDGGFERLVRALRHHLSAKKLGKS
jgi:serine/threonine protein kinase